MLFAKVNYKMVISFGKSGTCAGLKEAIELVPKNNRFMLIWCDLILPLDHIIPDSDDNIVGISKDFKCRWKFENGIFKEESSSEHGVAGYFIFKDKSIISDVPSEGEFVSWFSKTNIRFDEKNVIRKGNKRDGSFK